jgi:hypothetical protein
MPWSNRSGKFIEIELTPFRSAASLGLKAVLKGTWCAPGIREDVGAGLAALTVALSGDEP